MIITFVVGAVQAEHGSTAMLVTQAVAGMGSAYAALAYLWRLEPAIDLVGAALAA